MVASTIATHQGRLCRRNYGDGHNRGSSSSSSSAAQDGAGRRDAIEIARSDTRGARLGGRSTVDKSSNCQWLNFPSLQQGVCSSEYVPSERNRTRLRADRHIQLATLFTIHLIKANSSVIARISVIAQTTALDVRQVKRVEAPILGR